MVKHFAKQKKKVLVCGRLHMKKWPKANLDIIYSNSSVFLAENLSQDDPYLLYCALSCGLNTTIISRDLMRSHLFLLKDPYYKSLFRRWLSQNLYQISYIDHRGKISFQVRLWRVCAYMINLFLFTSSQSNRTYLVCKRTVMSGMCLMM